MGPALHGAARGLALVAGVFSLLNAGRALVTGFDASGWWVDLRPLPGPAARLLLAGAATLLVLWALWPAAAGPRRAATLAALGVLAGAAVRNAAQVAGAAAGGEVRPGSPVPFSLVLAAALALIACAVLLDAPDRRLGRPAVLAMAAAALGFPLAQMVCFGKTDYARPADAVVVFGARAYADGRCSAPLEDRVRTACALHRAGLAPLVVFSGGPGDGAVHEVEAMRRLALSLGVPDDAILCDRTGVNTHATVAATVPILRDRGVRRVLAVSHFYHLPRVKLAYQQAGLDVFTVPARESRPLRGRSRQLLREVAALWAYYLGLPWVRAG